MGDGERLPEQYPEDEVITFEVSWKDGWYRLPSQRTIQEMIAGYKKVASFMIEHENIKQMSLDQRKIPRVLKLVITSKQDVTYTHYEFIDDYPSDLLATKLELLK
jgi:hypothetical protein